MNTKGTLMWTIWVGGSEMSDYYVTKEKAEDIALQWRQAGYDDVIVQELEY